MNFLGRADVELGIRASKAAAIGRGKQSSKRITSYECILKLDCITAIGTIPIQARPSDTRHSQKSSRRERQELRYRYGT